MNNKGQAVLSEYVMIFFVVIAALVAMTVYLQRGFEARLHDARNFMVDSVINNSQVCDNDCKAAAGGNISHEYEPYYAQMLSDVGRNEAESAGATPSAVNWSIGAVYTKSVNETTTANATSTQLPPQCANGGC